MQLVKSEIALSENASKSGDDDRVYHEARLAAKYTSELRQRGGVVWFEIMLPGRRVGQATPASSGTAAAAQADPAARR